MRVVKNLIALASFLVVLLVCGYLIYFFHTINYLPYWLNLTIRILCIIAIIAAAVLCGMYMKSLKIEAHKQEQSGKKKNRVSTK